MEHFTGRPHLERWLAYGIMIILVLMPFHAVLTTWLASSVNHFDLLRIWKDLLMVPIGLGALWVVYQNRLFDRFEKLKPLVVLIVIYGLLEIVLGIWAVMSHRVNASAMIYGWINDLQYLAFFIITLLVAAKVPLKKYWPQLLLIPAGLVVIFGLLQHFILPADFLRHFGYGPHSLPLHETVDQKTAYIRLQSTLRGPNPLGAYLILIITALIGAFVKFKKQRQLFTASLLASLVVLFFSYSRSAYIGIILAWCLLVFLSLRGVFAKKIILFGVAGFLIIGTTSIFALRQNDHVQNIFFHTDEHSRSSESSNYVRGKALKSGLKDIWHEPLGQGPGTAGPASARNDHQARIAENYYLQIGQELGIMGLAIFLAINYYIFIYLWQQRKDILSAVLLASFAGISFVNLLSHAWSDDTLSIIWWGTAGIALAPVILNTNKHHRNGKTKKTSTT